MSEVSNLAVVHPEAEVLAAFAEDALPAHEREGLLLHLAGCPRCREVVFEAAVLLPEVAPEPGVERRSWFSGWFSGWRMLWPAGAALAAGLAIGVAMHRVGPAPGAGASGTQMATVTAPPMPPVPSPTALPGLAKQTETEADKRAEAGKEKALPMGRRDGEAFPPAAPRPALSQSLVVAGQVQVADATPDRRQAAGGAVDKATAVERQSESARQFDPGKQSNLAGALPQDAVVNRLLKPGSGPSQSPDLRTQRARMEALPDQMRAAAAAPAPAPAKAIAMAPPPTLAAPMAPPVQVAASGAVAPAPVLARKAPAKATAESRGARLLPSGLGSVSEATAGGVLIAVDPGGKVFLSGDGGGQWKPVKVSWVGRAVSVTVAPKTAEFEMKTADGASWVSEHGWIWTRR